MARSHLILLLPVLLSLSLLADATRNSLLPLRRQENNEDDHVILGDVFEQLPRLRLPSERENEMMAEVPELVRTRVRGPPETHNRFSAFPGLREGEGESIFRPREGEGDSVYSLREVDSDSIFLGRGGRKDSRFGRPGAGCRHHHNHGDEMKFGHFRGDHPRFRPHFLPSFILSSPEDAPYFPREFRPRPEREEHKHWKHERPSENEESGFEPQERPVFERVGRGFPEREHVQFERFEDDFPEREFRPRHEKEFRPRPEREEHKHWKHERPSENERSGFEPQERPVFERVGRGFPEREHVQFERIEKDFPEREHTGFPERSAQVQFERIEEDFPEREHSHGHGHGQWDREFRNEEGQQHGRHERQEDPAAPWTDWLKSLLPRN